MGFTLREVLGGARPQTSASVEPKPESGLCSTGKVAYRTRAAADAALRHINRTQASGMHRFRCPACEQFHLGHRRGVII